MQNVQNVFIIITYLGLTYSRSFNDIPCCQGEPCLVAPPHPTIWTTWTTWTTHLIPITMKCPCLPITMKCPHLLIMMNFSCLPISMTTPLLIHHHPDQCLLYPLKLFIVFHPMINSKLSSLSLDIYYLINTGTPCDENGEPLPDGTPPPHRDTVNGSNDWFLYGSWAEFELCNLLYRKSKMPAGQVDKLLNIIAAMQAMSGGELLSHHIRIYITPLMWQS